MFATKYHLNMQHLFVPIEIASKMNDFQFNEPCFGFWSKDGEFVLFNGKPLRNSEMLMGFTAPLYQQAIDWLRQKQNTFIDINSIEHDDIKYPMEDYFNLEVKVYLIDYNEQVKQRIEKSYYKGLQEAVKSALEMDN